MTHAAKVLADSISSAGHRLTTLEVTFPRIVLAEFNTHRMFSRNSASSRAIPIEKMIRMVNEHPYIPTHWGKNQKGMQANEELSGAEQERARDRWLIARDHAVMNALALLEIGVHKQITNRGLETYMWHTVIVSGTEWSNWDHLRRHGDAHPEIKLAADLMFEARAASVPKELTSADWHLPLIFDEDYEQTIFVAPAQIEKLKKISVARSARVSYLTHDGKRDLAIDVDMAETKLGMHMSPWEHVARPMSESERQRYLTRWGIFENGRRVPMLEYEDPPGAVSPVGEPVLVGSMIDGERIVREEHTHFCGNFQGFIQYRKLLPYEHDVLGARD